MAKQKKSNSQRKEKGELILIELLSHLLTKEQAQSAATLLFRQFGSFPNVVDAWHFDIAPMRKDHDSAELREAFEKLELRQAFEKAGLGEVFEKVASFLTCQQKALKFYLNNYDSGIQRIFDGESAFKLLRPKFLGRRTEAVALVLLDGKNRVLYNGIINEGSISEVPIYIRKIVQLCLFYNSHDAIIAHNHPSGNPLPSKNDLKATSDMEIALNSIEVNLFDHIILAENDYLSMKSSEFLNKIKDDVAAYKKALREKADEEEKALKL